MGVVWWPVPESSIKEDAPETFGEFTNRMERRFDEITKEGETAGIHKESMSKEKYYDMISCGKDPDDLHWFDTIKYT